MIFRTALKYKIWEWCLETLTKRFLSNFQIEPGTRKREVPLSDIKVGMRLDEIVCVRKDDVIFYHRVCVIESLNGSFIGFSYREFRTSNFRDSSTWRTSTQGVP